MDRFVEELKRTFGQELVSVCLYGSGARESPIKNGSDLNLMVVVKTLSFERIKTVERAVFEARALRVNPVFWTEEEIRRSADVFPIEFQHIKDHGRLVHGRDLFKKLSVGKKNLRHQLEFELRSKLLGLRTAWFELRGEREGSRRFLSRAATSFNILRLELARLKPGQAKGLREMDGLFSKCRGLKDPKARFGLRELEGLYEELYLASQRLVSIVDKG